VVEVWFRLAVVEKTLKIPMVLKGHGFSRAANAEK